MANLDFLSFPLCLRQLEVREHRLHGGAFSNYAFSIYPALQRRRCPIHLALSEADCAIGEGAIGSSPRNFPRALQFRNVANGFFDYLNRFLTAGSRQLILNEISKD